MDKDLAVIRSQQLPNKLSIAGGGDYDKIWIRDNVYVALALAEAGQESEAAQIYSELCKLIERFEDVLDSEGYPDETHELLPPRFTTDGERVKGNWGNRQHDAVGSLLFGIGQLYAVDKKYLNDAQKKLCQKLINYLEKCRYWEDKDDGMWEEDPVLHASSLAACISGIEVSSSFCTYDKKHHEQAKKNLTALLPRESSLHDVDMSLLTLIWPYGYKREDILVAVETRLLRHRGVIRHIGDKYEAGGQSESQWVMGIPWLGVAHFELGNLSKAKYYLDETEKLYTDDGLPESYLANNKSCVHTPLAWSHAMAIVLRAKLAKQPVVL